uniref:Si:dkey-83m22.7 n=1 Tax=Sphaeramia orbicularis TaxID=375764 RepID=A0A673CJL7_9TELE
MKKQKLEEERTMKIQRENTLLSEKIIYIMRTTGGTDNRNFYVRKSLGKEQRQLELLRITKENEMILHRLNQCKPHYNVKSWHEDWIKTLKVMDSISRYPRGRSNQQKVFFPYLLKCLFFISVYQNTMKPSVSDTDNITPSDAVETSSSPVGSQLFKTQVEDLSY